jgi:group I intron endonuclease
VYFVYKITNKLDNKSYIGKTNNLKRRFNQHIKHKPAKGHNSYISNVIKKYGKDNFVFEVLEESLDAEYISTKEYEYIQKYNTVSPNGYNLRNKIDNRISVHDISREKISKHHQGKCNKLGPCSSKYMGVCITPLNV